MENIQRKPLNLLPVPFPWQFRSPSHCLVPHHWEVGTAGKVLCDGNSCVKIEDYVPPATWNTTPVTIGGCLAESKFKNSQEHLSHSAGGTGPYLPNPGEFSNPSYFLSYFSFHHSAWQVLVTEGSSMPWPNDPAHSQDCRCDLTAPPWLLTV